MNLAATLWHCIRSKKSFRSLNHVLLGLKNVFMHTVNGLHFSQRPMDSKRSMTSRSSPRRGQLKTERRNSARRGDEELFRKIQGEQARDVREEVMTGLTARSSVSAVSSVTGVSARTSRISNRPRTAVERLEFLERELAMERKARMEESKKREQTERDLAKLMKSVSGLLMDSSPTSSPLHNRSLSEGAQKRTPFTHRSVRTRYYRDYRGRILFTDKYNDPYDPVS